MTEKGSFDRRKYDEARRELPIDEREQVDRFMGRVGELVRGEPDPTSPEAIERITKTVTDEMPEERLTINKLTEKYYEKK